MNQEYDIFEKIKAYEESQAEGKGFLVLNTPLIKNTEDTLKDVIGDYTNYDDVVVKYHIDSGLLYEIFVHDMTEYWLPESYPNITCDWDSGDIYVRAQSQDEANIMYDMGEFVLDVNSSWYASWMHLLDCIDCFGNDL